MYQIGEIMLNICDYTIQDHSRSPTLVSMESPYVTFYVSVIATCLVSCTVSEIWQSIRSIFVVDRGTLVFNALFWDEPLYTGLLNWTSRN